MKGGLNMNSKRGVSAVVATVLIIMITVAAVGIIWAAIIPMVRNSLDKGTACFDAQSDVSLITDGGYTCFNKSAGNISLQVKKGPNTKVTLVAVQALVFIGGNSVTYRVNSSNTLSVMAGTNGYGIVGSLPSNNEFKTVNIWDNGSMMSGSINTSLGVTKVKIAPVVTVGKTEEICEATQEVTLPNCA
jgi:flagellin-like protein